MAEEVNNRALLKKRSSSISAPGCTSIETIINPASGTTTPENGGTPSYSRRRPATRSQSARITARSGRRKNQSSQDLQDLKSHCTSEPRLNETEPHKRKGSQKKTSVNSAPSRKGYNFLDVPQIHASDQPDDDENVRLRTFSSSKQGVINRGDSFRRRRSHSNTIAPVNQVEEVHSKIESFRVAVLGSPGVGKDALLLQFRSSECINAYDDGRESDGEQSVSIILNGEESELIFTVDSGLNRDDIEKADALLVVYSVVDKSSFSRVEQIVTTLQDSDLLRTRGSILVANKIDLARSRHVSTQDGKCLACTFKMKFIEVSVAINHNVDELLAGILSQIRLKRQHNACHGLNDEPTIHWYKNRNVVRASMKTRQLLTWIFGKEDSKFKNCENLQIL